MNKILITVIILSIFLSSCSKKEYKTMNDYAQGTTFSIVYEHNEKLDADIFQLLREFDLALSTYIDTSIISKINSNKSVKLNELFIDFYNQSKSAFEATDGYFDITVGPLVKAWGFGVAQEFNTDSSSIDSIKAFVGMDNIWLESEKLVKNDERIYLDGNAIAQGQSVDFIADFLESREIKNYMVEIGGEVRAKGVNKKGSPWRIGIDKPVENAEERELQGIVLLKDRSLATSGNYRKFFEFDGVKYSHSIDPKSGYPKRDKLLSATILTEKCSFADAYATACMVMGYDKATAFVESNDDVEAYFIYADDNGEFKVFQTNGFAKYLAEE